MSYPPKLTELLHQWTC